MTSKQHGARLKALYGNDYFSKLAKKNKNKHEWTPQEASAAGKRSGEIRRLKRNNKSTGDQTDGS